MTDVLIGVDVGTGSARAGVFDRAGAMLAQAVRPIQTWRPHPDHVQQSSDDIWTAVCAVVTEALAARADWTVRGIGFDATCSLVVLDADGKPLPVGPDGAPEQDVIVWMDHRAAAQAELINATHHPVLRHVGGSISLEMQTPKLLWLKQSLPGTWARAAHFFDLPDYLTWRATGSLSRSLCSTVCKWTFLGHEGRWDQSFFQAAGLGDLADAGFRRIGHEVLPIGTPVRNGLSPEAAEAWGVPPGTPVATSAIDAHAGGLGVLGAVVDGEPIDLNRRVALVGGTSSCHMAVSADPRFVPGIWGPYFSAMVPGLWLNEGGQSATGALIDHLVQSHAAFPAIAEQARQSGRHVFALLVERLDRMDAAFPAQLTVGLHVMPDFHGNRSPRADATLRGMVSGLSLSATADDLALLYLAAVQAVAYGTRHIIAALNADGYAIDTILACGGGTKDPVFLREHADATGCRIVLPQGPDAVLLGAAMLGAVAGGVHADIPAAMAAMATAGRVIHPAAGSIQAYHDAKYAVFQRMYDDQMAYRAIMAAP